uniref:Putative secreted protein n=1 Tax=Anopheles darlingi TaxID=43151 RepID=A0A2M4D0D4_ANODA
MTKLIIFRLLLLMPSSVYWGLTLTNSLHGISRSVLNPTFAAGICDPIAVKFVLVSFTPKARQIGTRALRISVAIPRRRKRLLTVRPYAVRYLSTPYSSYKFTASDMYSFIPISFLNFSFLTSFIKSTLSLANDIASMLAPTNSFDPSL